MDDFGGVLLIILGVLILMFISSLVTNKITENSVSNQISNQIFKSCVLSNSAVLYDGSEINCTIKLEK